MPGAYKTLTAKQEAFVRAYMELGNATEAYGRIYTGTANTKTTNARNAHALLDLPKVQKYLEQLKQERAEKISKRETRDLAWYMAELDCAADIAKAKLDATALERVRMSQAKLMGLVTDKIEARTGAIDPEEAKPDIGSLWSRLEQNKGSDTQH
jgi:hypothetical protein